ncbi:MAG: type II secretion system protein [Alphaproteobacteria bacterium]|nr:type II secretion system protein [Alphaproteobacteria bacterium]
MPMRRNRGFTLVELALVMGVIGAVISAIWWSSTSTREAQRQNDAVSELQTVSQGVIALMQGQTFKAPFGNITSTMITAQAIPSIYIDKQTPTTADHPWSTGNFTVTSISARVFRVAFTNVSQSGCLALLLQGTSCQAGQTQCPTEVYTNGTAKTCQPNQTACSGAVPATGIGWQVMGGSIAATMCAANSYTGGTNNVSFDFSL